MITLASPWLLLLLSLPWLVARFIPAHREPRPALQAPFVDRLAQITGRKPEEGAAVLRSGKLRLAAMLLLWGGIVLALARPQSIEPPITRTIPARDLLLAVDLSGSMETKDFTDSEGRSVERLTAVKQVVADFLAHREGDRVGLIFFGTAPFVQAPFTEDIPVVQSLLNEAQVKMAGPQTAFGDALGLAIHTFEQSHTPQRVLIALTDGNDTFSKMPPAEAAAIAKDKGIVVHTVAVGDPRAAGEEALDEKSLQQVSAITGGLYSFAADRKQLAAVYKQLDQLEPRKVNTTSYRPRRDLFHWPLGAGVVGMFCFHALSLLRRSTDRARSAPPLPYPQQA